jgi:hypothetical protein
VEMVVVIGGAGGDAGVPSDVESDTAGSWGCH